MEAKLIKPTQASENALRICIASGVQCGLHYDVAGNRLRIGFNCDTEDIELFTTDGCVASVDLEVRDARVVSLRVKSGCVTLNGTSLSEGAQAIIALSQSVELNGIQLSISRPFAASNRSYGLRGRRVTRWAQICVSFVCGAVTVNHPYGVAQTTHVNAGNSVVAEMQSSATKESEERSVRAVQEFVQQVHYLGHTELSLSHGTKPGQIIATGYVKAQSDIDHLDSLAARSEIAIDKKIVPIDGLQEAIRKSIRLSADRASIEYVGAGVFRVATSREHRNKVQDGVAAALDSVSQLNAVWLSITDSHRALDREVGTEIRRGASALANGQPTVNAEEQQVVSVESSGTTRVANGFKSYSSRPGHRVYSDSVATFKEVQK